MQFLIRESYESNNKRNVAALVTVLLLICHHACHGFATHPSLHKRAVKNVSQLNSESGNVREECTTTRRSFLHHASSLLVILSQWACITTTTPGDKSIASAAAPVAPEPSTATTLPKVTNRVTIDVRISRPDGTFYVRGDESDELVKKYSLQIGLFGKAAPTHVERFLSYVRPSEEVIKDDRPLPSYAQSRFESFDQADGILLGGVIPSLEVAEFAGSTAIRYGGRILPAPLWLEKTNTETDTTIQNLPAAHSTKGLLIHRKLDVTPAYGITTRSDSGTYVSQMDREWVAFGMVLNDEGMEFLKYCSELPTYSVQRPLQNEDSLVQDAAKAVFDAQRDFFRGAAKSLGDSRISKLMPGKLLRRVEVTKVAIL